MKKFLQWMGGAVQSSRVQLAAMLALVAAAVMDLIPKESLGLAALLGTTTGQMANNTRFYISSGSPTSYLEIGNVKSGTFMDGSSGEVDFTNLASTWKEKKLGLPDGGVVTLELDTDFGDVGQAAALAAKNARGLCDLKVVLPGGTTPTITMQGFVRKFNAQTGVDAAVKSSLEFMVTGPVAMA